MPRNIRWQTCHGCGYRYPILPGKDFIAACNGSGNHQHLPEYKLKKEMGY